jgi:hypothetical protein
MARPDWMREDRDREPLRVRRFDDYGQADYSTEYAYDPARRAGYRPGDSYAYSGESSLRYRPGGVPERRTFDEPPPERRVDPRRGPSDRVLWAVIVERLEDERGLDIRDVEVSVRGSEVFLDGTVRRKADKRRIEDVADIDGVTNVQNNLRVRDRAWGLF